MRDLKRKDKLVEAAGDAYGKTLSLAVLDVCNDESVKQCINGIKNRHIDVLGKSNMTFLALKCLKYVLIMPLNSLYLLVSLILNSQQCRYWPGGSNRKHSY